MMKKWLLFCLTALCLFLFAACSQPVEYSAQINGRIPAGHRFPDHFRRGQYLFLYRFRHQRPYTVVISYPDGTSYVWEQSDGAAAAGGGPDWRMNTSMMSTEAPFAICCHDAARPSQLRSNYYSGYPCRPRLFNIIRPRTAWFLDSGWKYKDAEPSDMALSAHVIGGILALVIAVIVFMSAFA